MTSVITDKGTLKLVVTIAPLAHLSLQAKNKVTLSLVEINCQFEYRMLQQYEASRLRGFFL